MSEKNRPDDETDIELVSIEDLRTAFGGAPSMALASSALAIGGGPVADTVMCSGWSRALPDPNIYVDPAPMVAKF